MKRVLLGIVQPIEADAMKVGRFLANLIQKAAPNKGFDLAEVRARLKVIDKIEAAIEAEWIDLEDAEHALVERVLKEASFVVVDRAIIDIADRITGAKAPPKPE